MKLNLIIVCTIVAYVAAKPPGKHDNFDLKIMSEDCAKETNADLSILINMTKSEQANKSIFEKKEIKCYYRCMDLKSGKINDAGELQLEKIKELSKNATALVEAKKCVSSALDPCDKHHEIQKCLQKLKINQKNNYKLKYKKFAKECENETKTDMSKVRELEEMHCYMRCMDIKTGKITKSGDVNMEYYSKFNNNKEVIKNLKKCTSNNADPCIKNNKIQECVRMFVPAACIDTD